MDKSKQITKMIVYIITIAIMLISLLGYSFSSLNNQDDIFMDNFLRIVDILLCFFLLFCELEIGNCIAYFLTQKKSRRNMIWKILSFSFSICWICMLFLMLNSTNVFLSELLILFFTVLLFFSKLMCILTKNK